MVADLAGGEWRQKAREAAVALVTVARETPVSLNLRLLEDLRTVFLNRLVAIEQAQPHGLSTKTMLDDLAHWRTVRGRRSTRARGSRLIS